jgi:cytochrome c-type biogenesis protein CcmH/NrfG
VISALEVAGELWLQVHRFEDARAAFERAARQVGTTPRIADGLARSVPR